MKTAILSIVGLSLVGCSTLTGVVSTYAKSEAKDLAMSTVQSVVDHYKGTEGGDAAAAGLSAVAEVLQGYVGKQPPLQVAAQSSGVAGVGQKVVAFLQSKGWVTQGVVNTIHDAAQIAANVTVNATPTPAGSPPSSP